MTYEYPEKQRFLSDLGILQQRASEPIALWQHHLHMCVVHSLETLKGS